MSDSSDPGYPAAPSSTLEVRPRTPADARAHAALLARRLADHEVRLSVMVDLLERTEADALAHLDQVTDLTSRLARAGGVETVFDRPDDPAETDDALHPAVVEAEEILREQRRRLGRGPGRRTRDGLIERRVALVLSFVGFVVLGYFSAVVGGMIPGDALSRVGSGQSVLFSRDPHLEAIGCYEQAIQAKPDYADAWNNRGVAFSKMEEL